MRLWSMAFGGRHGYNRYLNEGDARPSYSMDRSFGEGKTPSELKDETGFEWDEFLGWVYEISDGELRTDTDFSIGDTVQLETIYDAPDLYRAYPQLRRMRVYWGHDGFSKDSGRYGSLRYTYRGIKRQWKTIHSMMILINAYCLPELNDDFRSTLVHEVQHAIQRFEKYNMGTKSPKRMDRESKFRKDVQYNQAFDGFRFIQSIMHELFPDEVPETPSGNRAHIRQVFGCWKDRRDEVIRWIEENCEPLFNEHWDDIQRGIDYMDAYAVEDWLDDDYTRYQRSKHEVQARNVSKRRNMTPEERRKSLARDTEDFPMDEQTYSVEKVELEDEESWT